MKELILLNLAILLSLVGLGQQGSFPVTPNFGGSVEAAHRARVADDNGIYVTNIAPHSIDHLQSYGLWDSRLCMIPSGLKAATVYSQVPTDGSGDFDVARASVATNPMNEDGLMEEVAATVPRYDFTGGEPYCLLEPQRTNLLTYPVSFSNAYWGKSGASIQGDPTTAGSELNTTASACSDPNGNEADATTNFGELNLNGTGANVFESQGAVKNVGSYALHTDANDTPTNGARFYKDAETDWGLSAGNTYKVSFDARHIGTGGLWAIGLASSNAGITNEIASLTSTDNTFVTYTFYFDYDANHKYFVAREFESSNNGGIYLDNLSCTLVTGYSAPHADSPLDVSAFKLVENSATSEHKITSTNLTVTNAASVTISLYAKQAERNWIVIDDSQVSSNKAWFDLDNGVVGTTQGSVDATSITAMADGWYRITMSFTTASTTAAMRVYLADADNSTSYSGDGTSGIYIAFAQVEDVAPYPTSWIYDGTEGSTTTRIADLVDGAGTSATFNSEEGVLYRESAALFNDQANNRYLSLSDGTVNNAVQLYYSSTTQQIVGKVIVGGVTVATLTYTIADETAFAKSALKWKVNDFALWVNGVERATDTSGVSFAASVLTTLQADDGAGNNPTLSKDREWDVFELLTDAQLTTVTT